ncbi:MAG: nucleotide pyrophosphohydrolase [Verrucomicrobia bacterium]|nr:nucleotide pyrophosphohydrolase [Verrucomicrobiota bacterium]
MESIKELIKQFSIDRDWVKFHSPKNLSMALSGEVGELIEIFQWLTEQQSREVMNDPATASRVREELADVFLYLVRLADTLGVDLCSAAKEKMDLNRKRFPIHPAIDKK